VGNSSRGVPHIFLFHQFAGANFAPYCAPTYSIPYAMDSSIVMVSCLLPFLCNGGRYTHYTNSSRYSRTSSSIECACAGYVVTGELLLFGHLQLRSLSAHCFSICRSTDGVSRTVWRFDLDTRGCCSRISWYNWFTRAVAGPATTPPLQARISTNDDHRCHAAFGR